MGWWVPLLASIVSSGPPDVVVRSDGDCLSVDGLVARVQAWAERADWPADVAVAVEHSATSLRIRVTPESGPPVERVFDEVPAACHDVELMAAVAIAMALDVVEQQHATTPVVERPASAATVTLSEIRWVVRPATPRVSLALAGAAAWGVLPFVTGDASVGVVLRWPRVALVGELDVGARRVARIGGDAGALVLAMVAPALGVCGPWDRRRWSVGLCALASAGPVVADAQRTVAPAAAVVPWVAMIARTEVALALTPRWSLVARSDLVIGVVRPSIAATREPTGQPTAWRTPRFGWRGGVGVRMRLGRIDRVPVKRGRSARIEGVR